MSNSKRQRVTLDVPTGWKIVHHEFFEAQSDFVADDEMGLLEDLLHLENKSHELIIDLGWYPELKKDGQFKLVEVRYYEDQEKTIASWRSPLRIFESRSRSAVIQTLEQWLKG